MMNIDIDFREEIADRIGLIIPIQTPFLFVDKFFFEFWVKAT
jgi:hypothetical protein